MLLGSENRLNERVRRRGPIHWNGVQARAEGFAPDTSPPGQTRAMERAAELTRVDTEGGRIPQMRKPLAAMALLVAGIALSEGCAPVPLPHYAAYGPRRVEELLVDSENLRLLGDDWERFWLLDQPSHLTPFRTHGGLGP